MMSLMVQTAVGLGCVRLWVLGLVCNYFFSQYLDTCCGLWMTLGTNVVEVLNSWNYKTTYYIPSYTIIRLQHLRVPSCVQQISGTLSKYIFYSFSFCSSQSYPTTPSRNLSFLFLFFLVFFSVALISWVFFFLLCSRIRYASTWFAYLDSLAFGFSLFYCLWPHNLYLS